MNNFFNKFSENLKKILVDGERIAKELSETLNTQHLLIALLQSRDSLATDILKSNNLNSKRVEMINKLIGVTEKKEGISVNNDVKSAIVASIKIAVKYNQPLVEAEHLLLALLSNKNFRAYEIINRSGVNPEKIKEQLEKIFLELSQAINQSREFFSQLSQGPNPFEEQLDLSPEELPINAPISASTLTAQKNEASLLANYSINLSEQAAKGALDPLIGRDHEIERLIQILSRRTKNNPILVGEPGVGKTSIVEGLADRINRGQVPQNLIGKEIVMLDLGSIVAGTMFRGQFEARIKKIFEEIISRSNLIIFIDELHTIIGTGSAEGSLDAANLLKPFLSKNQLRLIGATTFDEYKKQIEKDKAFERRFQTIKVLEPDIDQTLRILRGLKTYYEQFHRIKYTDEALVSAAELADRYIADRKLPDKAIDLIDEAAASTNINTNANNRYLIIQKKLSKLIKEKEAAVNQENYQRATEIRQEEVKINDQLTKLRQIDSKARKKLITKEDILKTVSRATGIPVNSLSLDESLHLTNLSAKLKQRIIGQDQAVDAISRAIKRSRVGISDPNRPIGSFIFLGPTGVGKTELAKVLAEEVFGSLKALIKIDMSEFMERHNLSRLVGAPAGYVGFDEGGKLTEQVRNQPYSLILFDEIEKAHPDVFNLLLQILEDGVLTDAKGRIVNFKNTLIILTSNIGSELFNHRSIGFNTEDKIESPEICDQLISRLKEELAPEFINRLDEIIVFNRLFRSDLKKIVKLRLRELAKRLQPQGIKLKISDEARELLEKEGFDLEYGARPLKRIIANKMETEISDLILKYGNLENRTVKIDRQKNKFVFTLI